MTSFYSADLVLIISIGIYSGAVWLQSETSPVPDMLSCQHVIPDQNRVRLSCGQHCFVSLNVTFVSSVMLSWLVVIWSTCLPRIQPHCPNPCRLHLGPSKTHHRTSPCTSAAQSKQWLVEPEQSQILQLCMNSNWQSSLSQAKHCEKHAKTV